MERSEALAQLTTALENGQVVTCFCACEIRYEGRAEAYLDLGERLLIVKADKSVLIHQPEGGMPINYLKAGATIVLSLSPDGIGLTLDAISGTDHLHVTIHDVFGIMGRRLEDGQKQVLAGNERDMSDLIKAQPSLISKDFKPLSREEHTTFGFIDVFGHDGKGNLIVVECKRYTAGLSCVTQLRRYVEKIKELKGTDKVKGIMASPAITPNAKEMLLKWGCSHVVVQPPMKLERHKHQSSLQEHLA